MTETATKVCTGQSRLVEFVTCGRELPLDSFPKSAKHADGHHGWCFDCLRKYEALRSSTERERRRRREGRSGARWRARRLALEELRRRHQPEFDALYEEFKCQDPRLT